MRYTLVFQNDIGRVEFSFASGVIIESLSSFGGQNVDFQTTKSVQAIGERLSRQSIPPKTIQVRGTILGAADGVREQMTHVIAPLAPSRLIYNGLYSLDCYVKTSPDVERYKSNAKFSFALYAPYPYWRKTENDTVTLVGLRPLFSFPWNISDPSPFAFSEFVEVGYVTVANAGEAPAPWTLTFLALNEVTNPRIYNMDTGKFVRILRTMADGEQIQISTEGDELSVRITAPDGVERDGFRYLDIDSEPFPLAVGDNFIKTDAEAGVEALRASIRFREGYVGV